MKDPASGRAQKGPSKSARTKSRILDAAAAVLCERGFAGTRLSDIAERAKCQPPAIYYYFDSREALIAEVIWLGIARLRTHVQEAVDAHVDGSAADRLHAATEAHLRYVLVESDYTMAAIRNAAQMPLELRERQLAEQKEYAVLWRTLFSDVREAGLLREGADERLARMLLLGALNWATEWWQPTGESVDTLVRNARFILATGFLAPEPACRSGRKRSRSLK